MQGNGKEVVSLKNVLKFGGAYMALIIGSGFATGQEIMQFFTAYGTNSLFAVLIGMFGFSFIGAILIRFGYVHKHDGSIDPYRVFFGKYFGKFLEWFIPTFCFMVVVIMISGAGATINQYFGIPHIAGATIMTVLTLVVSFFGLNRIVDIIGTLGPLTVIFTLFVAVGVVFLYPIDFSAVDANIASVDVPMSTNSQGLWWFSAILYVAYNIVCAMPFLIEMGKGANSKKEAALGGIAGGAFLMFSGLMLNLAMLSHIKEVAVLEIPILFLTELLSPVVTLIFTFILLNEIFNTAVPLAWTAANKFGGHEGTIRNKISIVVICILAFFLGMLPFGKLVGIVYPYTGYIGTAMIIMITVHFFRGKKNN